MKKILIIMALLGGCANMIPGAYMYDTRSRDQHGCLKDECYWDTSHGFHHCTCKGDADYGLL